MDPEEREELRLAEGIRKGPQRPLLPWIRTCRDGEEHPGRHRQVRRWESPVGTLKSARAAGASHQGAEAGEV